MDTASEREFYAHKFTQSHPWRWYYSLALPLHIGLYKAYWLKKRLPRGGNVLDLGCGGGRAYFAERYRMTGVDISEEAVENARRVYAAAHVADVRQLPFPSGSFDAVMSIDLLGHIPHRDKNAVLQEIRRVLKPGGITVHYIETERVDNIIRDRYPELYHENFIVKDGHFGLEFPSAVLARFAEFFTVRAVEGHAAYLSPIEDYRKRFGNELRFLNPRIRTLTFLSELVSNHTYARFAANCFLGIPARIVNRLAPLNQSSGLFVAAEKSK